MALSTQNYYGTINISEEAVATIASRIAEECYGVYDLAPYRLTDSILMLFNKKPLSKGVKIVTIDNRIYLDLYIIIRSEVNRDAVIESLRESVSYNLEHITGMRVMQVNIHSMGTRL